MKKQKISNCANCGSNTNAHPIGEFKEFPGWCMKCIHEEIEMLYYIWKQNNRVIPEEFKVKE